ncbi:hypothetical protein ABW20_dc0105648 [Dactylellina cionopaga]|nr:hypothetical protein ABW20_dc0105648 [Dactylellina cionopaga]
MIIRKAVSLVQTTKPTSVCWRCRQSLLTTVPRIASRPLHTTLSHYASPLPLGGTAAGPPPEPPIPQSEFTPSDRSRLRQAAFPKPRTERFWKDVHLKLVDGRYQILLDTHPVKTSSKQIISVPTSKPLLAHAIQIEWALMRNSKEAVKSHFIPITSLTSRAIELEEADRTGKKIEATEEIKEGELRGTREQIIDFAMGYLDTDTLFMISPTRGGHLAGKGEVQLRDRQLQAANEMIEWAQKKLPVPEGEGPLEFVLSDGDNGLLPAGQSDRTRDALRKIISKFTAWELVGLECAVILSKSLLVGLRLVMENRKGSFAEWDVEEAAKACNLETDFQIEQWGCGCVIGF